MPHPILTVPRSSDGVAVAQIRAQIDALLQAREDQPTVFPPEVLAAAERVTARVEATEERADLRDLPFVTLDPARSTDLDQALLLERAGEGYRVRYAIADVPLFVDLNGEIDAEARRRGTTVYLPDRRLSLHPEVLSEGAASLLPDKDTPALVWDLQLDADGELTDIGLVRAMVRSTAKLAYDQVQQDLDHGEAHPMMVLLQEVGALRSDQEARRGGASLNVPEQEVEEHNGCIGLTWRSPAGIEAHNAQISLLTGMAAAEVMLRGGIGLLRTMPPAEQEAIERFRRQTRALGHPWEAEQPYGEYLRGLDWRTPAHLALLNQATALFRGAGYAAFASHEEAPQDPVQAAIAAPYAHTTAPLRRLVDRFVLSVCWHLLSDRPVPPELIAALPVIAETMRQTASRNGQLERAAQDLVEDAVIAGHLGEELEGTVIDRREAKNGGSPRVEVQLREPPVTAWVDADAKLGQALRVRVEHAASEEREIEGEAAVPSPPRVQLVAIPA